jgi:1-phosphatidylinositol phosphodiesterase
MEAAMSKLLTYPIVVLTAALLISCGGGGGSTVSQQYIANITTDESETTLDLYATSEDDPEVLYLESFSLGYGSMNYLNDQGAVPAWQINVPDFCRNSANLGIDKVAPCVFAPLLQNAIEKYGTGKNKFSVTAFFNTNDNPQYTEVEIDPLVESLDTTLEGYGYDAQIYYDPEPAGHYHNAYSHSETSGTDNANWMNGLIDSQTLKQLSLPGTHDTMSHYGGDIVQTQSMHLAEQLKSGIRALDIRCRHYKNHCVIHHGSVYQNANFDDVLTKVRAFLQSHPTEFVVMRVGEEYKPEYNTRSFSDTFKTYFDAYGDLFWKPTSLKDTQPTVAQMRGKIVVLQDWDSSVNFGIQWNRNGSSTLSIQDHWEIRIQPQPFYDKWVEVDNQRYSAEHGTSSYETYVNFLSASSYIKGQFGWPYFFASGKSSSGNSAPLHLTGWTTPGWKNRVLDFPRVACTGKQGKGICSIAFLGINILFSNKLASNPNGGRVGIIYADFPGGELIRNIILRNQFR